MSTPLVIPCEEWGAKPRDTSNLARSRPKGVVVHHTATANLLPYQTPDRERERAFQLARAIQRSHLTRKWKDSGHHFLITRFGIILEGRHGSLASAKQGLVVRGSHAGTNTGNAFYFGLECEGNTDSAALTPPQWSALVELCAWLSWVGDCDTANIQPHRKFRPTICPGRWMVEHLDELRAAAHDRKVELLTGARCPAV